MTTGKRTCQELVVFELIANGVYLSHTRVNGLKFLMVTPHAGMELSVVKSPDNAHTCVIYIGGETDEEVRSELKSVACTLGPLIKEGLTINGKSYTFEPILTCDLAALVVMLGLYEVYRSQSMWRCPWCAVHKHKLGDFTIPDWPFHSEAQRRATEEKVSQVTNKSQFAAQHHGIIAPRVLDINLDHVVPCNMHAFMAIVRKLFNLLVRDIESSSALVAAFEHV